MNWLQFCSIWFAVWARGQAQCWEPRYVIKQLSPNLCFYPLSFYVYYRWAWDWSQPQILQPPLWWWYWGRGARGVYIYIYIYIYTSDHMIVTWSSHATIHWCDGLSFNHKINNFIISYRMTPTSNLLCSGSATRVAALSSPSCLKVPSLVADSTPAMCSSLTLARRSV